MPRLPSAALFRSGTLVLAAALFAGCGGLDDDALDALPPTESLFLTLPADDADASGTARQAVCADGSEAYDRLATLAATYNEAIQQRIELLKLVVRATQRQLARTGEAERSVTRGDATLTLRAVQADDGAVDYTVTVAVGDAEAQTILTGAMAADRRSGSWTVLGRDDRSVDVTWSRNDDASQVQVERTATGDFGERTARYTRDGDAVTLVFTGPEHTAEARWSRSTRDGSLTFDGVERCWEASDDGLEFCGVACPDA